MSQHRRGPWSQSEDAYLMSLVQNQGALNWVRIAGMLGTRTPKQCRERYHQNLKPSLNHEPITQEEGNQIEGLVLEIGKRWAEIARRLHGRSDNAVKNWWNGSQNRRKRMDRRKASHTPYDERAEMQQHYARVNMAVPRTLPMPTTRPMPAPLLPGGAHDGRYFETPLTSPSAYTPESELAPSLMSDCGSHYSTSPRYDVRSPEHVELPPLKMSSHPGVHISPRNSMSPTDTKLPSLSAVVAIRSPEFSKAESLGQQTPAPPSVPSHQRLPPMTPTDYFSVKSHLPTAPSSPTNGMAALQLRPMNVDPRDERTTKVNVSDLVD